MDEQERDTLRLQGYLFGLRVMAHIHGIQIASLVGREETERGDLRHWELVQEIAEGRQTLISSPAEIRLRLPDIEPDAKRMEHSASRMRVEDQDLAQRIRHAAWE
jgi:hypothetical protein